ncbi:MAG: TonB-dependent receptor [Flavobacteriaceae bacterium]|nr:TonB-dependent receptor [Flavobacteriaceae bacterium]MDG2315014.1 TonB-dependent receptor [Flavobacteriaceae bacterium]
MKRHPFVLVFLFCFFFVSAQKNTTLSGLITASESNESLIGVTILIPELNTGTVSNSYGFYSISVPSGTYEVYVRFLGFKELKTQIDLSQNVELNIALDETSEELEEVFVSSSIEDIILRKPQMSLNSLTAKTIRQTPTVLGEADVLKAIQLLPGISSAGEGASGFNVRGGAADQNLITLDEAIIFNSSHLFGFFSVFNPDAIKDLKLYKGGIPAKYGGRVSSVLDIYQKEGNSKEFKMNGGIGLISSRLIAEGPLEKDKGSFLLGARGTYAHLFLKLSDNPNSAYFYDLNTKLSYQFDKNNRMYLSGYFGRDVFNIDQSFLAVYGNSVFNLRWNHLFSPKLFSNLSLIYSDYYYGLTLDFVGFNWDSGIRNFNLKYDFKNYITDKITLNFGVNAIHYTFNPGSIEPNRDTSGINPSQLDKKTAFEGSLYADVTQQISERFSIQYGLRINHFIRFGQKGMNLYANDQPVIYNAQLGIYESSAITGEYPDTNTSKSIQNYTHFEPRLTLSYGANEYSLKVSYNRINQYLHLISNTNSPTPLDVWAPSGPYIKPQQLDQWAFGYFKKYNTSYSLQTEVFYKDIKNRLDYIDGADLVANEAIERVLLKGKSRAYGLEILFKKSQGAFQGWLAYTLSKSEQQTPGIGQGDPGINQGEWYDTPYDKTHDLSITGSYQLSTKWSLNCNFILQTGQPVTYPNGQYEIAGIVAPNYGLRNENRLPAYHRVDISATYSPKNQKRWKNEWVFGIYNLYNRKNAASIAFRQNTKTMTNEAVRFSIFGIVPAITYNFKF